VLASKQNKVGTDVISQYDYTVNALGQRTRVNTSGTAFPAMPSWLWGYDSLGQVTSADSSVNTSDRAFEYDAIGNRKKSSDSLTLPGSDNYTRNAVNQYTSLTLNSQPHTLNPSYDFDGNATAYPLPVAPTTNSTLTWDAENRQISSIVGSITTTYLYDAQSRRIAKTIGGTSTFYVNDGWNCIAEYSGTALSTTNLWGTDLSGTMQGAGGVGGLLAVRSGSTTHFPAYDGNGNVSEYLTSNGSVTAHFEYDPFGNTVVSTDFTNLFAYRFSTKLRDVESGLYYYGYRYYDPATGRWPSRDPIEERGGTNLYKFVLNNGVHFADILGLVECKEGQVKDPGCLEKAYDKMVKETDQAFAEFWSDAAIYGGGSTLTTVIVGGITKVGIGVLTFIPTICVMADNSTGDDSTYDKIDDIEEAYTKEIEECPCVCRSSVKTPFVPKPFAIKPPVSPPNPPNHPPHYPPMIPLGF
jgi:RHS repeat-associated protein